MGNWNLSHYAFPLPIRTRSRFPFSYEIPLNRNQFQFSTFPTSTPDTNQNSLFLFPNGKRSTIVPLVPILFPTSFPELSFFPTQGRSEVESDLLYLILPFQKKARRKLAFAKGKLTLFSLPPSLFSRLRRSRFPSQE